MKIGYGLVVALAATCGAVVGAPLHAQGTKPSKTVKAAVAPPAAGGPLSEVVGVIADRKITFGEVVAQAQQENASVFNQTVAQLVGLDASRALFGAPPQSSYTVTKTKVLSLLREQDPPLLGETLKTMLEFEAVEREIKKKGITVTNAQVDQRIDQFLKLLRERKQIPDKMTDAQFFEQNHVTRETVRKNFMIQAKLFALIQQDFVEKRLGHKLTPDDFFKSRHILVKVPMPMPGQTAADTKKEDDAALAKINQIAADIEAKKKTFEQAAQESSDDKGSQEKGGDLGVQMRTVFVPEFEMAAFSLKSGEVSKPVRSQFGYHLIQVVQRGAEIPEAERQAYLDNFESGQMQIYLRDLLSKTYLATNKLTKEQPQMPNFQGQ